MNERIETMIQKLEHLLQYELLSPAPLDKSERNIINEGIDLLREVKELNEFNKT